MAKILIVDDNLPRAEDLLNVAKETEHDLVWLYPMPKDLNEKLKDLGPISTQPTVVKSIDELTKYVEKWKDDQNYWLWDMHLPFFSVSGYKEEISKKDYDNTNGLGIKLLARLVSKNNMVLLISDHVNASTHVRHVYNACGAKSNLPIMAMSGTYEDNPEFGGGEAWCRRAIAQAQALYNPTLANLWDRADWNDLFSPHGKILTHNYAVSSWDLFKPVLFEVLGGQSHIPKKLENVLENNAALYFESLKRLIGIHALCAQGDYGGNPISFSTFGLLLLREACLSEKWTNKQLIELEESIRPSPDSIGLSINDYGDATGMQEWLKILSDRIFRSLVVNKNNTDRAEILSHKVVFTKDYVSLVLTYKQCWLDLYKVLYEAPARTGSFGLAVKEFNNIHQNRDTGCCMEVRLNDNKSTTIYLTAKK